MRAARRLGPVPGLLGLLLGLLLGCGSEAPPPPVLEPSAAWVVAEVFGPRFFDAQARAELVLPGVSFELPTLLDRDRYRFLRVSELRRVDAARRVGEVAFTIDGWPAQLGITLTHTSAGWRIAGVDEPAVQRALVEVLGIQGIPRSHTAEPWPGGLAGRDAAGRPTAAALVLLTAAGLWVDGQRVPEQGPAVKAALAVAFGTRQQLAWVAHATYRPQVALALPGDAAATRLPQLTQWATEAGAEALLLLVRDPQGGPAYLPLARLAEPPEGEAAPPVMEVAMLPAGPEAPAGTLQVSWAGEVTVAAPGTEGESAFALGRIQPSPPPPGLILVPQADETHARLVALVDDIRGRLRAVPLAVDLK